MFLTIGITGIYIQFLYLGTKMYFFAKKLWSTQLNNI